MRVPFDSLCLAAVVAELQPFVDAKAQKWVQVDEYTLACQLYLGGELWVWISWRADGAYVGIGSRPEGKTSAGPLVSALKTHLSGSILLGVRTIGTDRVAHFEFEEATLIVELMGKHSNLMLCDSSGKLLGAAKWLGAKISKRPILPGQLYSPPPFEPRRSLLSAVEGDDLMEFEGLSPFLIRALNEGRTTLATVQAGFRGELSPFLSGIGPYPISTGQPDESSIASYGRATQEWFSQRAETDEVARLRSSLSAQLRRVVESRRKALIELEEARDTARRASDLQQRGELILAYAHQVNPGDATMEVYDMEGQLVSIKLDPELNPQQNAEKLFRKAKKAKAGASEVADQMARQQSDLEAAESLLQNLEFYETVDDLIKARAFADAHRWLHHSPSPTLKKEEKPFGGFRIKELQAPGGYAVFYGENAEANDFLTMKMGKPNDIWLHVRGNVSAHVLLPTHNQPQRVPPEVIQFAAEVSARHSPLKHSSYVPVDWTLKKYVRRPKGSAKGFVSYTHERTVHVDPTSRVR